MRRRFMNIKGFTETFDINNYLTIEAIEDGLTVSFNNDIEYGIDGKGWILLKKSTNSPALKAGHTLSFRGNLTPDILIGIGTFTISKKCNLKGNCMSMLFGDNAANNYSLSGKNYAFYELFKNCNIINVSSNFLPATILAQHCYDSMFYRCRNLTTAPELPATALSGSCYYYMFYGCTNLNYIKMLATFLPSMSTSLYLSNWVYGVSSTGTFVKNPAMTTLPTATASNHYEGIPSGWTVVNDGEE